MKKILIFEKIAKYYFLFFIASYFLTYPIRVILKNPDISFTNYIVIFFIFILISILIIFIRYFSIRKFKKSTIFVILSLLCIILLYYINAVIIYPSEITLYHTFIKYISFSTLFISFLFFQRISFIDKDTYSVKLLLFILSLSTFIGTFLNSILWQIPYGVEINEKYIVGIFLRAGAGYLDPNFLAMNVVILFFLNFLLIPDNSVLKKINFFMLIGAIFFTFSRGSWIFFTFIFFIYLYKENKITISKESVVKFIFLLLIFLVILLSIGDFSIDFDSILRRFYDEEGMSSINDRFYQYNSALNYFYTNMDFSSLILGFGGSDIFKNLYGVHLHNFFLGSILDTGFLEIFMILFLLIYFYITSNNVIAKYLLIYWFLQASSLPNIPDNLFLIFIISLVKTRQRN